MLLPVTITSNESEEFLSYLKTNDITQVNVQLFKRDVEEPDSLIKLIKDNNLDVVSFHTPFDENHCALLIEDFCITNDLKESLKAIQHICSTLGLSDIPVVCHSELSTDKLYRLDKVAPELDAYLSICNRLKLCIENVPIYGVNKSGEPLHNIPTYTPNVVKYLNAHMNNMLVYSCLDICHAMMACRRAAELTDIGIYEDDYITLSDFINSFKDSCAIVHLANCTRYGNLGDHGTSFDSYAEISQILSELQTNLPNALIVLEISESDYSKRCNVIKTLNLLKEGAKDA